MPLPLASGMKDDWKNKAKLDSAPEAPQNGPVIVESHDGLTDEHALSVRPHFSKRKPGEVTEVSVFVCLQHKACDSSNTDCWGGLRV